MQSNNKFTVIVMWIAALSFILSTAVIGGSSGLRSNTIGKVGEIELTKDKFSMEYNQLFRQYNQMMQGKFDEKQAKEMGLKNQVLQKMAAQAQILNLAKDFGIIVTEKETALKLTSFPEFQTDGKFDRKIYDTFILNSGISRETFEKSIEEQIAIEKTFKLLNAKGLKNEFNAFKVAFEVADKLKYTLLTTDDVNITSDETKLKEFWETRKEQFKTSKKYTLEIQWTDTNTTEISNEEVEKFYNKHRFNYTDKNGKIVVFEEVKQWVKEDAQIAKSKKNALKRYVQLKKGELKKDETVTLEINSPTLSTELWSEIQKSSPNTLLKPKVVNNRYASVKILNIVNPVTKSFAEVKDSIHKMYSTDAKKNALNQLAEKKLTNIDKEKMNVSTYITLDNAKTQKVGLNEQETSNFVSRLFTSNKEKGIIPIGSKVMVYKIIEQKLISLENNETQILQQNVDLVKSQTFQMNLMKMLNEQYPTKLY